MEQEAQIPRSVVIQMLRAEGVDINNVTLSYWEKIGLLPRPVRQRCALYTPAMVNLIRRVRSLQAAGATLAEVRTSLVWPEVGSDESPAMATAIRKQIETLNVVLAKMEAIKR